MPRLALGVLPAFLAIAVPAAAQDELALRDFFEGRRVVLKIDMPATSEGVDVWPATESPVDYKTYGKRLKAFGVAIRAGESTVVTLVKLKKDLVEVQLGGGGFGTFGDDSSTSVNIPSIEKSAREKELEQAVKNEKDSKARRQLQRELDDLRADRERENRRIQARRVEAEEIRKARIAEQRLMAGSRFNVRYRRSVPSELEPRDLASALEAYLDVSPEAASLRVAPPSDIRPDPAETFLRKGMSRDEVEDALGPPQQSASRREGTLTVVSLVYRRSRQRIAIELVEDVVIRYTIASQ